MADYSSRRKLAVLLTLLGPGQGKGGMVARTYVEEKARNILLWDGEVGPEALLDTTQLPAFLDHMKSLGEPL